jgi:hypothetical protein
VQNFFNLMQSPFVNSHYDFIRYFSPLQKVTAYAYVLKCFPIKVSQFEVFTLRSSTHLVLTIVQHER